MNLATFPARLILSAAVALACVEAEAEVAYRIQRIDFPEGSSASDLNNEGEVVGTASRNVGERLPPQPGGEAAVAMGINDHGDVVGKSGPVGPLPVVWRDGAGCLYRFLPGRIADTLTPSITRGKWSA